MQKKVYSNLDLIVVFVDVMRFQIHIKDGIKCLIETNIITEKIHFDCYRN
jgi:hypothetical protein